jgi:hypothetical protein
MISYFIKNRFAPTKTVHATVIDKFISPVISKTPGFSPKKKHTVVFMAENKKLSFSVSEFSYSGYKIRESGNLKYKGNRIIEFR